MAYSFDTVKAKACGHWTGILEGFGISGLTGRHQACPGCGGKDRFRYDDLGGDGTFVCSQGTGELLAGDGFVLLEHVKGWDRARTLREVAKFLGMYEARPDGVNRRMEAQERRAVASIPEKAGYGTTPPKPKFDGELLGRFLGKCAFPAEKATREELALRSRLEPVHYGHPRRFLSALYGRGEKVLIFTVFRSQGQFLWTGDGAEPMLSAGGKVERVGARPGESWRGEIPLGGRDGVYFLANPVDGRWHAAAGTAKESRRSGSAVSAWRYLLLESDEAYEEEWLRVLMVLPLRIVSIVTSGGASLHALVRVDAGSKAEFDRYRDQALQMLVAVGADPGAISGVRLTRLPGCMRGDREQELLFLNPAATGTPIAEMARNGRTERFLRVHEGTARRVARGELGEYDAAVARLYARRYGGQWLGGDLLQEVLAAGA